MTEGNHEAGATDVTVRHVRRTRRICEHNATEIGALVRLARQRLGMSQTDAAICCGVGRRFLVELENGKPTVQLDKMLVVLDALGIGLMVRGPGVSFTADDADRARDTGSVSVSIEGKIDETFSAALTAGGVFGGGVTGGWGAAHLLWKF